MLSTGEIGAIGGSVGINPNTAGGGGVLNPAYSSTSLDQQSQTTTSLALNEFTNIKNLNKQLSGGIDTPTTLLPTPLSHLPVSSKPVQTSQQQQQQQQQTQQQPAKIKIDPASFVNLGNQSASTSTTTSKFFSYHQNTKLNLD